MKRKLLFVMTLPMLGGKEKQEVLGALELLIINQVLRPRIERDHPAR
jgi:hypothetical protein